MEAVETAEGVFGKAAAAVAILVVMDGVLAVVANGDDGNGPASRNEPRRRAAP